MFWMCCRDCTFIFGGELLGLVIGRGTNVGGMCCDDEDIAGWCRCVAGAFPGSVGASAGLAGPVGCSLGALAREDDEGVRAWEDACLCASVDWV